MLRGDIFRKIAGSALIALVVGTVFTGAATAIVSTTRTRPTAQVQITGHLAEKPRVYPRNGYSNIVAEVDFPDGQHPVLDVSAYANVGDEYTAWKSLEPGPSYGQINQYRWYDQDAPPRLSWPPLIATLALFVLALIDLPVFIRLRRKYPPPRPKPVPPVSSAAD
ncbi:MAG TPA: hypothetical protein VHQ86_03205 [Candidatus Saccharimonadia bacterium]|jgi:hypothetical protein|nr:hypothetical protein [Candidatus Saccharimonadia bacterium]